MSANVPGQRWFHVMSNTYGTWLRGDRRGWRSRHHREHVEGDYRDPPPPGKYAAVEAHSRRLMKRPPVRLTPEQRRIAGEALVERLLALEVRLLALSLDSCHFHLLGGFPPDQVRRLVGLAKKCAAFSLRPHGLTGGVWGRRCKVDPIRDRDHHRNAFRYILNHVREGAWTWDFREGVPRPGKKR